jgi:CheY-like chemotaxis protein
MLPATCITADPAHQGILRRDLPFIRRYSPFGNGSPKRQGHAGGAAKVRLRSFPLKVRVFVVDAHPLIASTLSDILRLNGFDAVWFTNSHEALTAAKFDCPDLVISEIGMSGLSGVELAIRLKELQLDCNILLINGYPGHLDLLDQAENLGHHFQVIQRPIIPRMLIAEIRDRGWGISQRRRALQFRSSAATACPISRVGGC